MRAYKLICASSSKIPDMGRIFPSLAGLRAEEEDGDFDDPVDEDMACQVITAEMAKYR